MGAVPRILTCLHQWDYNNSWQMQTLRHLNTLLRITQTLSSLESCAASGKDTVLVKPARSFQALGCLYTLHAILKALDHNEAARGEWSSSSQKSGRIDDHLFYSHQSINSPFTTTTHSIQSSPPLCRTKEKIDWAALRNFYLPSNDLSEEALGKSDDDILQSGLEIFA